MFSFGIFTTHLPYFAIIAFYAYFLIIGVEKAKNEKLGNESFLTFEIDSDNFNIETCSVIKYFKNNSKDILKTATLENHVFKRKLKHPDLIYSHYRQECFYYTFFYRPPPTLVYSS